MTIDSCSLTTFIKPYAPCSFGVGMLISIAYLAILIILVALLVILVKYIITEVTDYLEIKKFVKGMIIKRIKKEGY